MRTLTKLGVKCSICFQLTQHLLVPGASSIWSDVEGSQATHPQSFSLLHSYKKQRRFLIRRGREDTGGPGYFETVVMFPSTEHIWNNVGAEFWIK